MAGGGGEQSHENPLPLNVVPLIDVIFCLLLFFMCSFHFKGLEGKITAWLPTNKGMNGSPAPSPELLEVPVTLQFDAATNGVLRIYGRNRFADTASFADLIGARVRAAAPNVPPVVIHADPNVPWRDVVDLMDGLVAREVTRIEFALAK